MGNVFVVDYKVCNGCHNCQVACKDEHCEQPWLPYTQAQPMTGHFWCKVEETERGQVPVVKLSYQPKLCNHCAEAPCQSTGDDSVYTRDDGLVIIDPAKAKGRRDLVDLCPVGAIYYNEELDIPQKCTGCAHLLDNGWNVPRCVDACPTEALRYLDESEVDLSLASTLEELDGVGPKVYYFNAPKRFIAGAVVDLEADELLIGKMIELHDTAGTLIDSQATDDFGDFFFDQIEKGTYVVHIGKKIISADVTERDLCLGDIAI